MCLHVADGHPFYPVRQRVGHQIPRLSGIDVLGVPENGHVVADRPPLLPDRFHRRLDPGIERLGPEDRFDVQVVEEMPGQRRIQDVASLVDAKLLEDHGQLLFQNLADTVLDRVLDRKVDCTHGVRLADAVHPSDALLQLHRIPRG